MTYDATFVDTLWRMLKAWAGEQAAGNLVPTLDECAMQVKRIAAEIIGPHDSLRPDAVAFFAAEASEMIAKSVPSPKACS